MAEALNHCMLLIHFSGKTASFNVSEEAVQVDQGDFLLKWIIQCLLIFFPTILVTGLEQGEEHHKQITTGFKAIAYTTLNLELKSLVLSVFSNIMGFFVRVNMMKTVYPKVLNVICVFHLLPFPNFEL